MQVSIGEESNTELATKQKLPLRYPMKIDQPMMPRAVQLVGNDFYPEWRLCKNTVQLAGQSFLRSFCRISEFFIWPLRVERSRDTMAQSPNHDVTDVAWSERFQKCQSMARATAKEMDGKNWQSSSLA